MPIAIMQDLPRSPVNLSAEYVKYTDLTLKYTPLTTIGDSSWTSPSSGVVYSATTGGEQQLFSLLSTALDNYILDYLDWNDISATINNSMEEVKLDILETRSLVERQLSAEIFVNQTGYGAYTLFDNTSDGTIDNGNTTATINTTTKTCTFDSTGTKVLKLQSRTFNNDFTDIKCRINNYVTATVVNSVNNSNLITLDSPNYPLVIGDKVRLKFAYGSNPYTNATVTNVSGTSPTYNLTLSVEVDATAGSKVVIPTQYKITQNSTELEFDAELYSSADNGYYLQYKLIGQTPNKTINLTVTGKSTVANSVAYTVE